MHTRTANDREKTNEKASRSLREATLSTIWRSLVSCCSLPFTSTLRATATGLERGIFDWNLARLLTETEPSFNIACQAHRRIFESFLTRLRWSFDE